MHPIKGMKTCSLMLMRSSHELFFYLYCSRRRGAKVRREDLLFVSSISKARYGVFGGEGRFLFN